MMLFLLNTLAGLIGYEVLFLVGSRCCGERTFAVPFFVFPMAIVCGVLSLWCDWMGTLILLGLQAIIVAAETWRVRRSWDQAP